MTLPRALSERLILVASLSRTPSAPVFDWRSEPARSTMFSLPTRMCAAPSAPTSDISTVTVKSACERLERSFMAVRPVTRRRLPACSTASISATDLTTTAVRSRTYTPVSGCSLSSSLASGSRDSRSRTSSW